MKTETLWKVNVGSRTWKMENVASDFDVSEVYAVPSEIILKGMNYPITKAQSKRICSRKCENKFMRDEKK